MINRLFVISAVVALATLSGCGGSQPPIGAPGTTPQVSASGNVHQAPRSQRQFLYLAEYKSVNSTYEYQTAIVSYHDGHEIGEIANFGQMCSDSSGNVYIDNGSSVSEYAPGGKSPIAQVALPNGVYGFGCSVDPTTESIAVGGALVASSKPTGWLAVYPSLNGSPTIYTSTFMENFDFCGYDDAGNLFLDGYHDYSTWLNELPKGQSQFTVLYNVPQYATFGPIQWDGQYITVENAWKGRRHDLRMTIYQLSVSGSSISVVGETELDSPNGPDRAQYSWIQGGSVVKPFANTRKNNRIGLWHYPQGGLKPYKILKGFQYVEYPLVSTSYTN